MSALVVNTAATGHPDRAPVLFTAAKAAVVASGNGPRARVEMLLALEKALTTDPANQYAEGLADVREAHQILVEAGAETPGSPLRALLADVDLEIGTALALSGDVPGAIAQFRQVIDLVRSIYGADHPEEAAGWSNLGVALRNAGDPKGAVAAYQTAIRIRTARGEDDAALAIELEGLGLALQESDRFADSIAPIERAVALAETHLGPDDPRRVEPLIALGEALSHDGRYDDARRAYDRVIAFERAHLKTTNLAFALGNRAEMTATDLHRCDLAIPDFLEAVAVFEANGGSSNYVVIWPLAGAGRCLVELRRFAEARPLLERAIAAKDPGLVKAMQSLARVYHGRLLYETGERERGLAEVRAARAELQDHGKDEGVREVDAWLKTIR
jgi:tetratricopeptide (TPR) repeat protein